MQPSTFCKLQQLYVNAVTDGRERPRNWVKWEPIVGRADPRPVCGQDVSDLPVDHFLVAFLDPLWGNNRISDHLKVWSILMPTFCPRIHTRVLGWAMEEAERFDHEVIMLKPSNPEAALRFLNLFNVVVVGRQPPDDLVQVLKDLDVPVVQMVYADHTASTTCENYERYPYVAAVQESMLTHMIRAGRHPIFMPEFPARICSKFQPKMRPQHRIIASISDVSWDMVKKSDCSRLNSVSWEFWDGVDPKASLSEMDIALRMWKGQTHTMLSRHCVVKRGDFFLTDLTYDPNYPDHAISAMAYGAIPIARASNALTEGTIITSGKSDDLLMLLSERCASVNKQVLHDMHHENWKWLRGNRNPGELCNQALACLRALL